MKIGNRDFAPKLWAVALFLAVASCMVWLGSWQLQRAALKVSLQQATERSMQASATPIAELNNIPMAAAEYRRVSISGAYDPDRQFLWDNRTYKGRAGYEVISLLALEDERVALVNRGWIALGASRSELPEVAFPQQALTATVTLEGFLSTPSKGFASGAAVENSQNWPKRLQYFDYAAISEAIGKPVVPAVVQAQALSADASGAFVLTSRPEWLTPNWQPAASGPAKHYSYAFQWFAMAVGLTGIFIAVNAKKRR